MAYIPLKSITFPDLPDTYTIPQVDTTLTVSGAAADAKTVGDRLDEMQEQFDLDSLTSDVKTALMTLLNNVAFKNTSGPTYLQNLYAALYYRYWAVTNTLTNCTTSNASEQVVKSQSYTATITPSAGYTLTGATVLITMGGVNVTANVYNNGVISIPSVTGVLVISATAVEKTVSSIDAVFTQGSAVIYDIDSLDTLKQYLVVTATYTDNTTEVIPSTDYTLSGSLATATSTITASFGGKSDTFTVNVTVLTEYLLTDYTGPNTDHANQIFTISNISFNNGDYIEWSGNLQNALGATSYDSFFRLGNNASGNGLWTWNNGYKYLFYGEPSNIYSVDFCYNSSTTRNTGLTTYSGNEHVIRIDKDGVKIDGAYVPFTATAYTNLKTWMKSQTTLYAGVQGYSQATCHYLKVVRMPA